MTFVLYVLCLVACVFLILVSSIRVRRSELSHFELNRRAKSGDPAGKQILARELMVHDVLSLQRALQALLLVLVAILALASAGWLAGSLVAIVVALGHGTVARLELFEKLGC